MAALYQQLILRHSRQPLNYGKLKKPTKIFSGVNYLCGDQMTFYVTLDKQRRIKKVLWQGSGCAISRAAASLFSEMIKGKTLRAAQKITTARILKQLRLRLSPTRLKCALLPLYILRGETITSDDL